VTIKWLSSGDTVVDRYFVIEARLNSITNVIFD